MTTLFTLPRRALLLGGSSLALSSVSCAREAEPSSPSAGPLDSASTVAPSSAGTGGIKGSPPALPPGHVSDVIASNAFAALEKKNGGRLGAFVLDPKSGRSVGHRQAERFGMCSTFKLSLAALVLREADAGRLDLDEVLRYTKDDLIAHSPTTKANLEAKLGGTKPGEAGMTIAALAETTQLTSDNAAANLLLKKLGGPEVMTKFWRELGDTESRLDRFEPEMNLVPPGEVRDTITPQGIAKSVAKFTLGDVLRPASRARLVDWMEKTATGVRRIRASLPAGWTAGDKTGTMDHESLANKVNDLAVLYPPASATFGPLVVIALYEADGHYPETRKQDEAVLARVGEIAIAWAS